jgi:hypothetical protein
MIYLVDSQDFSPMDELLLCSKINYHENTCTNN